MRSHPIIPQYRVRTFVENQQLALAHNRPREREDLALADGQVAASARDRRVERDPALVRLALEREQARGAQRVVEHDVVVEREGVEVLAEGATEELGLRWTSTCVS